MGARFLSLAAPDRGGIGSYPNVVVVGRVLKGGGGRSRVLVQDRHRPDVPMALQSSCPRHGDREDRHGDRKEDSY
jgi:hypothetical protein